MRTPDNVVRNGADLDAAIGGARAAKVAGEFRALAEAHPNA